MCMRLLWRALLGSALSVAVFGADEAIESLFKPADESSLSHGYMEYPDINEVPVMSPESVAIETILYQNVYKEHNQQRQVDRPLMGLNKGVQPIFGKAVLGFEVHEVSQMQSGAKLSDVKPPAIYGTVYYKIVVLRPVRQLFINKADDMIIQHTSILTEVAEEFSKPNNEFPTNVSWEPMSHAGNLDPTRDLISSFKMTRAGVAIIKIDFARKLPDDRILAKRRGLINVKSPAGDHFFTLPGPTSGRYVLPGFDDHRFPMRWAFESSAASSYVVHSPYGTKKRPVGFTKDFRPALPNFAVTAVPYDGEPVFTRSNTDSSGVNKQTVIDIYRQKDIDESHVTVIKLTCNSIAAIFTHDGLNAQRELVDSVLFVDLSVFIAPNNLRQEIARPDMAVIRERFAFCSSNLCSLQKERQVVEATTLQYTRAKSAALFAPESWNMAWLPEAIGAYFAYTVAPNTQSIASRFGFLADRRFEIYRAAMKTSDYSQHGLMNDYFAEMPEFELEELTSSRRMFYRAAAVWDTIAIGLENDAKSISAVQKALLDVAAEKFPRSEHFDWKVWEELTQKRVFDKKSIPRGNLELGEVAKTWIYDASYPVISVKCQQDSLGSQYCTIEQRPETRRYLQESPLWSIPLSYKSFDNATVNFEWFPHTFEEIIIFTNSKSDLPPIFKVDGRGFYRVEYSAEDWSGILGTLKGNIDAIDRRARLALYSDALFSKVRDNNDDADPFTSQSDSRQTVVPLEKIVEFLHYEKDPFVFEQLLNMILEMRTSFSESTQSDPAQKELVAFVQQIFGKNGTQFMSKFWTEASKPKVTNTDGNVKQSAIDRTFAIVRLACYYMIPECIDSFKEKYNTLVKTPCSKGNEPFSKCSKLPALVRSFTYCLSKVPEFREQIDWSKPDEVEKIMAANTKRLRDARDAEPDPTEKENLNDAIRVECRQRRSSYEIDEYSRTAQRDIFYPRHLMSFEPYE